MKIVDVQKSLEVISMRREVQRHFPLRNCTRPPVSVWPTARQRTQSRQCRHSIMRFRALGGFRRDAPAPSSGRGLTSAQSSGSLALLIGIPQSRGMPMTRSN